MVLGVPNGQYACVALSVHVFFKVSVERFEADGLLVEGAVAVEIGRHHRDVAHAHRLARR